MKSRKTLARLFGAAVVASSLLVITACDPVPRRTLTAEEKIADMEWAYSVFGANYAPLEYKAQRYGFDWDALKTRYREEARVTQSNDEFYAVLHKFVSEFKDAHTSSSLTNSDLPGRARVAYLGFSGERKGDALLVKELLPTIDEDSSYPIHVGDEIIKIDGVALTDIVRGEMVKSRDLGQDESNLSFHFNKIFTRISTARALPARDVAVLTVKDDDQEREVQLPWVTKDLVQFRTEQAEARAAAEAPAAPASPSVGSLVERPQFLALLGFDGHIIDPVAALASVTRGSRSFSMLNTFRFIDDVAAWTTNLHAPVAGVETMRRVRNVPERAQFIEAARTYPTYVTREPVLNAAGQRTGSRLVATMLLDTFSPAATEETVSTEFKNTLNAMKELGVNDLVIDLINNGGGSVSLGMHLAQALSNTLIEMPQIQFRLNDDWLDDIQQASLEGDSDAERELARRLFETMQADAASGRRLSRPVSTQLLVPFEIQANRDLEQRLNIVLMVNEMCASMCDIFTAVLKDNGMARVVGARTMGAGGNVVGKNSSAPNSGLELRQTESLILRRDGSYIENNGVEPDVVFAVNESADEKYDGVRAKALESLLRERPATVPATPTTGGGITVATHP